MDRHAERVQANQQRLSSQLKPSYDFNPIAPAMLEGARSIGIPTFENQNGRMMEGGGGAALFDLRVRDGRRLSAFRTYTYPLAHALGEVSLL